MMLKIAVAVGILAASSLRLCLCLCLCLADDTTPLQEPAPGAARPTRIESIPLYKDYYDNPHLYNLLNVLIHGIKRSHDSPGVSTLFPPTAYAVVQTVGDDTGWTDYFEIGYKRLPVVQVGDEETSDLGLIFEWDRKVLLPYRKNGTDGLRIQVYEDDWIGDDLLIDVTIPVADFPSTGDGYVEYRTTSDVATPCSAFEDAEIIFEMKLTEMVDKLSTRTDFEESMSTIDGVVEYKEHVLDLPGGDNALVQSWVHTDGRDVAGGVLWVIGRNDAYMHPHVLKNVFGVGVLDNVTDPISFDVFVLNWRENGHCLHRGWVEDAFFASHNKYANFTVYHEEVRQSLDMIRATGSSYDRLIGYGHSTGGAILLDYIHESGDDEFDAFILNSPFLDWGFVGGALTEFVINNLDLLVNLNIQQIGDTYGTTSTPDAFADDPIPYLNRDIVPSAWHARYFSQYHVDWSMRPQYSIPLTGGFGIAATEIFDKFQQAPDKPFTLKPTLVLTSEADDVLVAAETIEEVLDILEGGSMDLRVFKYNSHDVFLSDDREDTVLAMGTATEWIKGFYLSTDVAPSSTPTAPSASPLFCFSGTSTAHPRGKGMAPMNKLSAADEIWNSREEGYRIVHSFGHRDPNVPATFLRFVPSGPELTENHLVLLVGRA